MHFSQHMHSIKQIGHLFSKVNVVFVQMLRRFPKTLSQQSEYPESDEVVEPS